MSPRPACNSWLAEGMEPGGSPASRANPRSAERSARRLLRCWEGGQAGRLRSAAGRGLVVCARVCMCVVEGAGWVGGRWRGLQGVGAVRQRHPPAQHLLPHLPTHPSDPHAQISTPPEPTHHHNHHTTTTHTRTPGLATRTCRASWPRAGSRRAPQSPGPGHICTN